MSLAQLEAEVSQRGLTPVEIDVEGSGTTKIVRVWCDLDGERLMTQEVAAEADLPAAIDRLAAVWLRALANG